jgi:hypothetical protein
MSLPLALAALLAAPAALAEDPKPDVWTGTAGAGLILLTGNADSISSSLAAAAQRKAGDWAFSTKLNGAYGKARSEKGAPYQTAALAGSVQLRADRKITDGLTGFALGGVDTDHVAAIEYRAYGEGGLGYAWIDRKDDAAGSALLLRTDLGFRYAEESRWSYYATSSDPTPGDRPDVTLAAPRLGAAFRWQPHKGVAVTEDAEVLSNVSGDARWLSKSVTKLTTSIVGTAVFGVTYTVNYDSAPVPGKVHTDTALGLTLEAAF